MLKKIPVARLRPGMFIHELCGDWMSHPFWRAQFILKGEGDLRRIVEAGIQHVYIDTARGLDDVEAVAAEEVQAAVEQEIVNALSAPRNRLSGSRCGKNSPAPNAFMNRLIRSSVR
ncbi:DUF3391 domain-containing protein [Zoogloea sp.]|uniref:DUF3391 domain-containing protein n=1 Tax=Zoogloea sp. TaxID=49181 RepID=UPI00321FD17D